MLCLVILKYYKFVLSHLPFYLKHFFMHLTSNCFNGKHSSTFFYPLYLLILCLPFICLTISRFKRWESGIRTDDGWKVVEARSM